MCLLVQYLVPSLCYALHVHCRGFLCVRLWVPFGFQLSHLRALPEYRVPGEFSVVSHTLAFDFLVPTHICYTIELLFHFVIFSPMHASRLFTLDPFNFPRVSLYVVPCFPPCATQCFPLRYPGGICAHSMWVPHMLSRSLHRVFIVRIAKFISLAFPRCFTDVSACFWFMFPFVF